MSHPRSRSRSPGRGVEQQQSRPRSPDRSKHSAVSENGGGGGGGGEGSAKIDSKAASMCRQQGCTFYGSIMGFCTAHATAGPLRGEATAADRQKASDSAVKQFDQIHLKERYYRKFRPFIMSDPDFNRLIAEMKRAPIEPPVLFERFKSQKWLLTAEQAHNLMAVCSARYEDAIFARCIDRDKLMAQSREGYYIEDFDMSKPKFLVKALTTDADSLFVQFNEFQ